MASATDKADLLSSKNIMAEPLEAHVWFEPEGRTPQGAKKLGSDVSDHTQHPFSASLADPVRTLSWDRRMARVVSYWL